MLIIDLYYIHDGLFFSIMDLFISYYQLILIPLWPVLWDYKVPIFEVPIMGTFTYSDVVPRIWPT